MLRHRITRGERRKEEGERKKLRPRKKENITKGKTKIIFKKIQKPIKNTFNQANYEKKIHSETKETKHNKPRKV